MLLCIALHLPRVNFVTIRGPARYSLARDARLFISSKTVNTESRCRSIRNRRWEPGGREERHTVGKFAAVRRTLLLRQQAYLITWYAVFVCSFVLQLVGHGILFEALSLLPFSRTGYTRVPSYSTIYSTTSRYPYAGILHDDGISGCFRKLRARVHDITVKIKLRDGELFIFKGHARAFDVASRVHSRPSTTAVAKGKEDGKREKKRTKKTKKIEGSRGRTGADVSVLNKTCEKNIRGFSLDIRRVIRYKKGSFISSCT